MRTPDNFRLARSHSKSLEAAGIKTLLSWVNSATTMAYKWRYFGLQSANCSNGLSLSLVHLRFVQDHFYIAKILSSTLTVCTLDFSFIGYFFYCRESNPGRSCAASYLERIWNAHWEVKKQKLARIHWKIEQLCHSDPNFYSAEWKKCLFFVDVAK